MVKYREKTFGFRFNLSKNLNSTRQRNTIYCVLKDNKHYI